MVHEFLNSEGFFKMRVEETKREGYLTHQFREELFIISLIIR